MTLPCTGLKPYLSHVPCLAMHFHVADFIQYCIFHGYMHASCNGSEPGLKHDNLPDWHDLAPLLVAYKVVATCLYMHLGCTNALH